MTMKKISSKGGFTLTELLVTVVIISLLGIAVSAGLATAVRAHSSIRVNSEADVLSGTLAVELADELRFAEDISNATGTVTFTSRRFGVNSTVTSDTNGHIVIRNDSDNPILSESAYMGLNATAAVDLDGDNVEVTITITKDGSPETVKEVEFSVTPLSLS